MTTTAVQNVLWRGQALLEMAKTWIQATLEVERGLGLIDEGTPLRNL
jgi:hypothetical protein